MPHWRRFAAPLGGGGAAQSRKSRIEPADAYGEVNPELVIRVPASRAPPGLKAGLQVQLSNGMVGTCTKIDDKEVGCRRTGERGVEGGGAWGRHRGAGWTGSARGPFPSRSAYGGAAPGPGPWRPGCVPREPRAHARAAPAWWWRCMQVVLDLNHELAGKPLTFDVELVALTPKDRMATVSFVRLWRGRAALPCRSILTDAPSTPEAGAGGPTGAQRSAARPWLWPLVPRAPPGGACISRAGHPGDGLLLVATIAVPARAR